MFSNGLYGRLMTGTHGFFTAAREIRQAAARERKIEVEQKALLKAGQALADARKNPKLPLE